MWCCQGRCQFFYSIHKEGTVWHADLPQQDVALFVFVLLPSNKHLPSVAEWKLLRKIQWATPTFNQVVIRSASLFFFFFSREVAILESMFYIHCAPTPCRKLIERYCGSFVNVKLSAPVILKKKNNKFNWSTSSLYSLCKLTSRIGSLFFFSFGCHRSLCYRGGSGSSSRSQNSSEILVMYLRDY